MTKVVFYSPHQDDEHLSFGASILTHIQAGYDVHVVLCTDGAGSNLRNTLGMTRAQFRDIRNREFIWSCGALGIKPENIHLRQSALDGQLTVAQSKAIINEFEAKFPNAFHKAFTWHDPHPDHANMGIALKQLYDAGSVSDARFYIKTVQKESEGLSGIVNRPSELFDDFFSASNYAYRIRNEANGFYALGERTAGTTRFDELYNDPRSYYHTPTQNN